MQILNSTSSLSSNNANGNSLQRKCCLKCHAMRISIPRCKPLQHVQQRCAQGGLPAALTISTIFWGLKVLSWDKEQEFTELLNGKLLLAAANCSTRMSRGCSQPVFASLQLSILAESHIISYQYHLRTETNSASGIFASEALRRGPLHGAQELPKECKVLAGAARRVKSRQVPGLMIGSFPRLKRMVWY